MAVPFKPAGYHSVIPYLLVEDAAKQIDFLQKAFAAEVVERMTQPDGSVNHAEVRIDDTLLMMGRVSGEWKAMPASLYVYVKDTDAVYRSALRAGATSIMEPANQFYGDRNAGVKDPLGNNWWIATHIEDVPPDELARRAAAAHH